MGTGTCSRWCGTCAIDTELAAVDVALSAVDVELAAAVDLTVVDIDKYVAVRRCLPDLNKTDIYNWNT